MQSLARQFRHLRHSPEIATHLLQLAKAVVAATVSWWVVVEFFDSQVPFLAPWMALVTVYPTVYQSLFRGVQSLVMSWLGVGLSFVVGYFLGVNLWTFGLALLVGMLCGLLPGLRKEGTTMATTAIFVLSSAFWAKICWWWIGSSKSGSGWRWESRSMPCWCPRCRISRPPGTSTPPTGRSAKS